MRPITRSDHEAALEQLGLTGGALEAAVGALARLRHESRVKAAAAAAMAAAAGNHAAAAAILLSDGYVRQTDRHPALAGLGKGRRKAADGDAWDAAIEAAGCWVAANGDVTIEWRAANGRVLFDGEDVTALIPPWIRVQIAGCEINRHLAVHRDGYQAAVTAWAAAYNAALEEGNLDPHPADFGDLSLPGAPLPDCCAPVEDVFAEDDA
jgi:hypothetical protein